MSFSQMLMLNQQAQQGQANMRQSALYALEGAKYKAGLYRQAGENAMSGARFQADIHRKSGLAAVVVANYNIALDQQATRRSSDAIASQIQRAINSNTANFAKSRSSLNSRSLMVVQNEVMSTGQREIMAAQSDALQRQTLTDFQGKLTQWQYEVQALSAIYQGELQKQQYENQARAAEYEGRVEAVKSFQQAGVPITRKVLRTFNSVLAGTFDHARGK